MSVSKNIEILPSKTNLEFKERRLLMPAEYGEMIYNVARPLAIHMQGKSPITKDFVKGLMVKEFGGTDAEGAWQWKDAYEAQEIGQVLFLFTAARLLREYTPERKLNFLREKQYQGLTHTHRSEDQQMFQQFSTPLTLAYIAVRCAQLRSDDVVLEPSAGTGILATMAKLNMRYLTGSNDERVVVNELDEFRKALLSKPFGNHVFGFDAEYINDYLPTGIVPSVVIANPPFSRRAGMKMNRSEAILKHLESAMLRTAPGGRIVLISGENFKPSAPKWQKSFVEIQKTAEVVGSFGVNGNAYYKNGTSFPTRITVFDKHPAPNPGTFSNIHESTYGSIELLDAIKTLPQRGAATGTKLLFGINQAPAKPQSPAIAFRESTPQHQEPDLHKTERRPKPVPKGTKSSPQAKQHQPGSVAENNSSPIQDDAAQLVLDFNAPPPIPTLNDKEQSIGNKAPPTVAAKQLPIFAGQTTAPEPQRTKQTEDASSGKASKLAPTKITPVSESEPQVRCIALPKDHTARSPERSVAEFFKKTGLSEAVLQGDDFHQRIENAPYIPLVVERHGDSLYLTHYLTQNGDMYIDSEMVYSISESGQLKLEETAVSALGMERRGKDINYARLFARNILAQGFAEAYLSTLQPKGDDTAKRIKAEVEIVKSPTPEDKENTKLTDRSDELIEVTYDAIKVPINAGGSVDGVFEAYAPKRIRIHGAHGHPTDLVESSAMAAVVPPIPTYHPKLARHVVEAGLLSAPQLETLIYAGNSHSQYLKGYYRLSEDRETLDPTTADDLEGRRYRSGYFLGDGTGCGKGRQVAGVILDNFNNGRTKAVWISKSETLCDDARRDYEALGGDPDTIHYLGNWKISDDITLSSGIVFLTYATLRTERGNNSRLQQISEWLGSDFDGVIAFDEAHEMGNATERQNSSGRGLKRASLQGIAGVKLQNMHPEARVMYISATGATEVSNLAYATRLGLWGTGEFPFQNRGDFIDRIENGGVAAMEVVARDMKTLGLMNSRVLSFCGVENETLNITLTPEQVEIYNLYAKCFEIMYRNLQEALETSNGAKNRMAKSAAYSAFESTKQRFFNHLLTAMKAPEVNKEIERRLEDGCSVVVQVVSTNESLISRRIESVPEEELNDLNIDLTPREGILSYLDASFPIYLYKEQVTENGTVFSELAKDSQGDPVVCQEALRMKHELMEQISLLPPLPGALEQILHHFGEDKVAEVTGRKIRVLYDKEDNRFYVSKRNPSSANREETDAFMNGQKRILVFSKAGGTGRSYHASLAAINQERRVHILLEPGWKADDAVQGLGRSHRTHQAIPPIFIIPTTDVRGELRFTSTISRRIAQLGALTRGQRQAAGQDIFDDTDNLESLYANKALRILLEKIARDQLEDCSCAEFEEATGLKLRNEDGSLKQEMPRISTFLNRLLALPLDQQNFLFEKFDELHKASIESAIESGTYDSGLQALAGDSFEVLESKVIYTHPTTEATTVCSEVSVGNKVQFITADDALAMAKDVEIYGWKELLYINAQSGNAAVKLPTGHVVVNGELVSRVRLMKPVRSSEEKVRQLDFLASKWEQASSVESWRRAWDEQIARTPDYRNDRIFFLTGLHLPIWTALDAVKDSRVYRAQMNNGDVLLGRVVPVDQIDSVAKAIGFSANVNLGAEEVFNAVMERQKIQIGGGVTLRCSTVEREPRIEVTGSLKPIIDRLKLLGCYTDMISYQTRVFVSTNPEVGIGVIKRLQEQFGGGGGTNTLKLYPDAMDTDAKRALYDELGDDKLALLIDEIVRTTKKADWIGHKIKEREVFGAIHRQTLAYDFDAAKVYDLVRAQSEYM